MNEELDTEAQELIDEITEHIFNLMDAKSDADWNVRQNEIDKLKDRLLKDYGIAYNKQ